ncbi:MAG: 50S ribosomal protein L15 [Armatimonadetes bacterium]|nr:50S ribosomal protein L15 [Armatimonadota bacterium]HOC32332.1 50S ribosomal protein L15 [Armatimonadota bacterium]
MNLHELSPAPGSHKDKVRLGRGTSSGKGRTCARGTKGQKHRTNVPPFFEGGQTPLHRRLPKRRGFTNKFRVEYAVVNVSGLDKLFEAGAEVTPDILVEAGCVREGMLVKILGTGEIGKSLKVSAHAFSESAKAKIEAAGGSVEVL